MHNYFHDRYSKITAQVAQKFGIKENGLLVKAVVIVATVGAMLIIAPARLLPIPLGRKLLNKLNLKSTDTPHLSEPIAQEKTEKPGRLYSILEENPIKPGEVISTYYLRIAEDFKDELSSDEVAKSLLIADTFKKTERATDYLNPNNDNRVAQKKLSRSDSDDRSITPVRSNLTIIDDNLDYRDPNKTMHFYESNLPPKYDTAYSISDEEDDTDSVHYPSYSGEDVKSTETDNHYPFSPDHSDDSGFENESLKDVVNNRLFMKKAGAVEKIVRDNNIVSSRVIYSSTPDFESHIGNNLQPGWREVYTPDNNLVAVIDFTGTPGNVIAEVLEDIRDQEEVYSLQRDLLAKRQQRQASSSGRDPNQSHGGSTKTHVSQKRGKRQKFDRTGFSENDSLGSSYYNESKKSAPQKPAKCPCGDTSCKENHNLSLPYIKTKFMSNDNTVQNFFRRIRQDKSYRLSLKSTSLSSAFLVRIYSYATSPLVKHLLPNQRSLVVDYANQASQRLRGSKTTSVGAPGKAHDPSGDFQKESLTLPKGYVEDAHRKCVIGIYTPEGIRLSSGFKRGELYFTTRHTFTQNPAQNDLFIIGGPVLGRNDALSIIKNQKGQASSFLRNENVILSDKYDYAIIHSLKQNPPGVKSTKLSLDTSPFLGMYINPVNSSDACVHNLSALKEHGVDMIASTSNTFGGEGSSGLPLRPYDQNVVCGMHIGSKDVANGATGARFNIALDFTSDPVRSDIESNLAKIPSKN